MGKNLVAHRMRFFPIAQNDTTTPLPLRPPKIPLEQQIQQCLREVGIIVNMFVELEMAVNHILQQIIDNMIESKTCIFGGIDAHACLKRSIVSKSLLYFG
jgi:hypothetical protein